MNAVEREKEGQFTRMRAERNVSAIHLRESQCMSWMRTVGRM